MLNKQFIFYINLEKNSSSTTNKTI